MNTQKDLRVKLQRNRNIKGLSMLKALQALGLKRMSCSFERQANWFVHSHPILTIWGILLYIDGDVGVFVIEHPKMLCTIHLRIAVRRHPHIFQIGCKGSDNIWNSQTLCKIIFAFLKILLNLHVKLAQSK